MLVLEIIIILLLLVTLRNTLILGKNQIKLQLNLKEIYDIIKLKEN